jgi:long-chain acyl-CoA synthetase
MDTDGQPWPEGVVALSDVTARGRSRLISEAAAGPSCEGQSRAIARHALATITYTSGTTGERKGVMLTHGNILSNVEAAVELPRVSEDDVALSFLPLSHAFERMVLYAYLDAGASVAFAESEALARDLARVRPTLMTAVPRVFEKIHASIYGKMAKAPALRRAIFDWAVGVGLRRSALVRGGTTRGHAPRRAGPCGQRSRVPEASSGNRWAVAAPRFGQCPAAAHDRGVLRRVGLTITEGYGLTEASPVLAVNPLEQPKSGTVGRALPGIELRIARDDEILARGPNIFARILQRSPGDAGRARVVENRWRTVIEHLYEEGERSAGRTT